MRQWAGARKSLISSHLYIFPLSMPDGYPACNLNNQGLDYKIVLRIFSMIHVNKTDCHSMGGFCVPINELIF